MEMIVCMFALSLISSIFRLGIENKLVNNNRGQKNAGLCTVCGLRAMQGVHLFVSFIYLLISSICSKTNITHEWDQQGYRLENKCYSQYYRFQSFVEYKCNE